MNKLGDIKSFSKIAHYVLGVAIVVYTIAIVNVIIAEIWLFLGTAVEIITVGSIRPFFFDLYRVQLGSAGTAFIPLFPFRLTAFSVANAPENISPFSSLVFVLFLTVIGGLIALGVMLYLRFILRELKRGVSPFSPKMVDRFLLVTIFITVNALISNPSFATITLAGFMWLMYYIFDHGRKLQEESDTTL